MSNKYYVQVYYRSKKGNPCTKSAIINADSHSDASNILHDRVSKYKNCERIDKVDCNLFVPIMQDYLEKPWK